MQLADFIRSNIEPILAEWVAFARTKVPAAELSELALRDHAGEILAEIVDDMNRAQGEAQRLARSQGLAVRDPALKETPSRVHAMQRVRSGFKVNQMVSEYRALRTTVLRLWGASAHDLTVDDLEDVTRFNEAVDQALAESLKFFVAEVDRARNLFLGVLGHDLRTPLGTIVSCANYQLRTRPEGARESNMILRSAVHMKGLVDDLLEYTRNRLGVGMAIEPAPVQLERFTREVLDEIIVSNPGRAIGLEVRGDVQGVWDAGRLHQVLTNLVGNALKYGAPGSPIGVSVDGTEDDDVVLAVRNVGTTIAAEILPDLFEPLVRGGAAASQLSGANMGLGLYIAREIVTAHGGRISVTSTDAEGTRFEVRLPREGAAGMP